MARRTQDELRFVVQHHRATADHYDLRFEADGALLSWAVPKGPTLDPTRRRTAFRVGDHPMEYLLFEGVIPSRTYGAGDVVVWDTGTWRPSGTDDPRAAVEAGELHADVFGQKLRGRFALVRRSDPGEREQWLLVHKRDEHAVEGWEPADHPLSVLTGRTNDEVARDRDRAWRSDLPADAAQVHLRPSPEELDAALGALDELGSRGTWDLFGRSLTVTNLDKELFPGRGTEPPVTKRELLRYTAAIAPTAVRYLEGRALNLRRHPTVPRARGSGTSSVRTRRRRGWVRGTTPTPTRGRPRPTPWSTNRLRSSGRPSTAPWSGTPGRLGPTSRTGRRTP